MAAHSPNHRQEKKLLLLPEQRKEAERAESIVRQQHGIWGSEKRFIIVLLDRTQRHPTPNGTIPQQHPWLLDRAAILIGSESICRAGSC